MTKQTTTTLAALLLLLGSALAQERTIEATASVQPKAPATGETRLEVVFTESGKPIGGLKLTASVAMTNMDMGTAHPPVKEVGAGHYVVRPMLLMSGPWRVSLASADPKFTVNWDMTAGSRQPWQPAKQTIKVAGTTAPVKPETPKTEPPNQEQPKTDPNKPESPQKEPAAQPGYGGHSGHATASMPQLKEKNSYAWEEGMDFDTRTGFGKLEPMVRMMILMMVGGSGMEGMKMAPMDMKFDSANFTEGGDDPVKDMPAKDMSTKPFKVAAHLGSPKMGDNNVVVTITTPDGKPVEQAKITTSVAMTNMDMGAAHPSVRDLGKGKYGLKATFSMAGPWRLTLIVSAAGKPASTYTFEFEAK